MQILLAIETGRWVARINGEKYKLTPVDEIPLVSITRAIEDLYPRAIIKIAPEVTDNPWARRRIEQADWQFFPPYKEVSDALLHPGVKFCPCGKDAYYDPGVHAFRCVECLRVESLINRWAYFRIPLT